MEATLEEALIERLSGRDVKKVILFGSHVWGTPGDDTDVDLLVVARNKTLIVRTGIV